MGKLRRSKNRSLARKKADKYFSLYIRLKNSNEYEICRCVTCGNPGYFKEMDCGHWRRRGLEPTRYEENNTAPQCKKCNYHRSGEPEAFEEYILQTYGEQELDRLRVKSLMRSKRSQDDYEWIAQKYKNKLDELCQKKSIQI